MGKKMLSHYACSSLRGFGVHASLIENRGPNGIVDAERHLRTPNTLAISVKTICMRMLVLCKADSMCDPGTTLASATLAQKAAEQTCPKY